jgi:hypothetical protein
MLNKSVNPRICFISLSPPDAIYSCSTRNESILTGLIDNGALIDYVTVRNRTGLSKKCDLFSNPAVKFYYLEKSRPLDVLRVAKRKNSLVLKIANRIYKAILPYEYIPICEEALMGSGLLLKRYSHLVTSSDPKISHRLGCRFKGSLLGNPKWVQYWGDPMVGDISSRNIIPQIVVRNIEGNLLAKADRIVYTSPFTLKAQSKKYEDQSMKMVYLPTPYSRKANYSASGNSEYVIGHYGTINPKIRDLEPLVCAVGILGDEYRLNLIGETFDFAVKCNNTLILPPVSDIEKYYQKTDLLVVVLNKTGTQIPGKLYHLAGINRPILVVVDGDYQDEMAAFVKGLRRYFVCKNDPQEIAKMIVGIKSGNCANMDNSQMIPSVIASKFLNE